MNGFKKTLKNIEQRVINFIDSFNVEIQKERRNNEIEITLLRYGASSLDIPQQVKMLNIIALFTNESIEQISSVYTSILAKGKANIEDVCFMHSIGVPLASQLSKQKETSPEEIYCMLKIEAISFNDIKEALMCIVQRGGVFYIPEKPELN